MRLPQALRGCARLPHVGPHPGLPILGLITIAAALASVEQGKTTFLAWISLVGIPLGAIMLWGANDRALLSDDLVR